MNIDTKFDILKIDTNPLSLRIISDVYLIFKYKKYLPVVDFLDTKSKKRSSLIVQATSLATFLEELRLSSEGTIIDHELWIQKESEDKFAKYIISEK